jgi:hypothetical protein
MVDKLRLELSEELSSVLFEAGYDDDSLVDDIIEIISDVLRINFDDGGFPKTIIEDFDEELERELL